MEEKFYMRWHKTVTVMVALVLAVCLAGCGSSEEKRAKFLERGKTLFEAVDYSKATLEFKNALQVDPEFAEAYYWLAEAELREQNPQKAYGLLNKAVEINPDYVDAQAALAYILNLAGEADKAKEKVSLALSIDPQHARARLLKHLMAFREGKGEEAEAGLRQLIKDGDQKTEACMGLAVSMMSQGRMDEAEAVLNECLKGDEKNAGLLRGLYQVYAKSEDLPKAEAVLKRLVEYYPEEKGHVLNLARFYVASKQTGKAEDVLLNLIEENPEDCDFRATLAGFYEGQGEQEKALAVLKKGISELPDEAALPLFLGQIYEKNDQVDLALETYRDFIKAHPLKPEAVTARNRVARIYVAQEKIEDAMAELNTILEENPKDVEAHLLRGRLFLAEGKGLDAIGDFRTVVQENPEDARAHDFLARAHMVNDEKALAVDNWKKAVNLDPNYNDGLHLLLSVLARDEAPEEAIGLLENVVEKASDNLFALNRLGDFYLAQGKLDKAEQTWQRLQEEAPENPEGFVKMSFVHAKRENASAAERSLDQALELQPGNVNILERAALLQLALQKPDRALEKCRAQIEAAPDAEAGIRLLMSRIYATQREYDAAEAEIRRVFDLKPDAAVPYVILGNLYAQLGKIDEGIREFKGALKREPNAPRLKMTIATLYLIKDDTDTALEWYEQIVEEHPGFIPGLNGLAYLYADRYPSEENLNRGLELLAKIPDEQKSAHILDTHGWLEYRQGNYEKAVEMLEKAKEAEESPIIHMHLGLAYLRINNVVQARTALEKALENEGRGLSKQDKQDAKEALEKLNA
jgi:tetratricopeptide (TPR) repeat protein